VRGKMKNYSFGRSRTCAFMLLEFLIYIVLVAVVYLLFCSVSNRALLNILNINQDQERELELALATDFLRRDLLSASMFEKDWSEQNFIFKKFGMNQKNKSIATDVCWYPGRLGLMRAEGQFAFAQKKWQNKSVSLVCKNVVDIRVRLQKSAKSGFIQSITVNLSMRNDTGVSKTFKELMIVVRPRCRVL
jgi:hypothetical protein